MLRTVSGSQQSERVPKETIVSINRSSLPVYSDANGKVSYIHEFTQHLTQNKGHSGIFSVSGFFLAYGTQNCQQQPAKLSVEEQT